MLDTQSVTYLSMLDTLEKGLRLPCSKEIMDGKQKQYLGCNALKFLLCCGKDFEICQIRRHKRIILIG